MGDPGSRRAALAHLVRTAPSALPRGYAEFLAGQTSLKLEIEGFGSGLVWLWGLGEILALNEAYGFEEFAPGLFGIGTDGCGELYVFDLRDPQRVSVGSVPSIPLDVREYRVLASSFGEFAALLARSKSA